jgi:putative ABC transport system permease protein
VSAVWRASRAAVRRRRVQTFVIGLVVFASAVVSVVALGLLEAVSGPYERAFESQRGAHAVTAFDARKTTPGAVARTRSADRVRTAAGPFDQAVVTVPPTAEHLPGVMPGQLTVAGRADPGGPVDRIALRYGRWPKAPGEIVLAAKGYVTAETVGSRITVTTGPGGGGETALTIVGFAVSHSRSAEAWVTPGQAALLKPTARVMLYRFDTPGTAAGMRAGLDAVTAGLPPGALLGSQSHLDVKAEATRVAAVYVPFLTGFGVLGVAIAVLITAQVVGGAVVSGFRTIGVLKAIGFTPRQVVTVHLLMVLVPALVGGALGTALGGIPSAYLLDQVYEGMGTETLTSSTGPWVYAVTALGLPAVVALAAFVPASRAHGLSAARALSAGSAPRTGRRGRRAQRWLAGTRLPRPAGLGLGLPLARPGRSLLTVASIVLGVATVTLAVGLTATVTAFGDASRNSGRIDMYVFVGQARFGEPTPTRTDAELEALLRSLPGAAEVTALDWVETHIPGHTGGVHGEFLRGAPAAAGETLVEGRAATAPGEIVGTPRFLKTHGLAVGDRTTVVMDGRSLAATIVGSTMDGDDRRFYAHWSTLATLRPEAKATQYVIRLDEGADRDAYHRAVRAADPGLRPVPYDGGGSDVLLITSAAGLMTLLLGTVAALGVFNTVVLETRERRRDLGTLKSLGMTPRQVVLMVVTSMAALGVLGGALGLPLGMALHDLIVPAMADAGGIVLPDRMMAVWDAPRLALTAPAGLLIAVLGAAVPARSAGRLTIAKVLRNE